MLSTYLGEQHVQQHAATRDQELIHQQRVQLALASRWARSTQTQGRVDRVMRWLTRRLPEWTNQLDAVHTEECSGIVIEGRR
jgi:hypothetical protein